MPSKATGTHSKTLSQTSVKLPTKLKNRLSDVAKAERRPLSWVLIRAVENYINTAEEVVMSGGGHVIDRTDA